MDETLPESRDAESGSDPMLSAQDSEWSRSTKPCLDPRTATSDKFSIYIWRQYFAAFLGLSLAWTAPAVPILLGQVEDAQPLRLSLEQASWAGGLIPLASLGGALVAGPLAERVGRKGVLLLCALPTALGWLLMAIAGPSMWLLLLGRTLTGVAGGAASGPTALYCEEIAHARVRGAVGSLQYLMNSLGCTMMYALGALLPYFWFTASATSMPIIFLASFCWMPESPAYLASHGRLKDAQQALCWLRGPDVDFKVEMENILASRTQAVTSEESRSFCNVCSPSPRQTNALRGLLLVLALMFFQQMSGMGMLTFYAVQLFQKFGGNISSYLSTFLIGVTNVIGVVFSTITVDKLGRRCLLLMSSTVMGFCIFALALYTHLEKNSNTEGWDWSPLALLILYSVMFSVGLGPIPWFSMAELLPMYSKAWASPIAVCINRLAMFFVVKESPLMLEYFGQIITYIIFGSICFGSALFVFWCLPETKGKSKAEILKDIGGVEL